MKSGGKASSLLKLKEGGFTVPPFFVCDSSWTEGNVLEKIRTDLPKTKYFAVRSSAENEDSQDKSFAGHFYSAVGISKEMVFGEIANVIRSFNGMSGSVIVQEFIPSDLAGVMFSQIGEGHIVVNAIAGLCVPVVQGDTCDEYIFDTNGELIDKQIASEKSAKFFKNSHMVSERIKKETLGEKHIRDLIRLAKSIQTFFGSPQDIEWCFHGNILYVLQSRPITKDFALNKKEYFDSANIAESYSGIVLPLTYTFAQLVYKQVYKDLLRMSGVSRNRIDMHSSVFENLLGSFYGRMYYNMNNWYQMAAFVPGYKRNKANFELMITSNVRQNIATNISPSLGLKMFYPVLVVIKVCLFGLTSRYFNWTVKSELKKLRATEFSNLQYQDCVRLFNRLNIKLLRKWYIAIENDFFVMTYLGILKKLVDESTLQTLIKFQSKATEQAIALSEVSKKAKANGSLWNTVDSNNPQGFKDELKKNPEIEKLIGSYMATFGGRFANELKLESIGVDEDITKLLSVLKAYVNYEPKSYTQVEDIHAPFLKKVFIKFILGKFKKYASRREEFRLLRSNTFAVARRLFRQMGNLLVEKGELKNLNDVFYLHLKEILSPESYKRKELGELVEQRRHDYLSYKNVKPPVHFVTSDNIPPEIQSNESAKMFENGRPASPGIIRGKIGVFREFFVPTKIDFDILVTSHTDPGWTSLIALSKGLIIEHGGVLSHASIVARELGIPAVIGAINAVDYFKDGQLVEINGSTGSIKII